MKKISVIIISYNEKQYLSQAIESCINQKNIHDLEVIIGDDGSDDGSIELIKKYKGQYPQIIQYFVMERKVNTLKNVIASIRVSNVIKRALQIATGEYIACLSGDDFYCDEYKLANQVTFLDEHPYYVADVSGFKKVYEDGTPDLILNIKGKYPRWLFWGGYYIHISAFVWRRKVYDENWILEYFCDDTGLIYSIACAGKWHYSKKITFAYRQRNKSIMYEADTFELSILELCLYEDCKKSKRMRIGSAARVAKHLEYCYVHHDNFNEEKYKKYLELFSSKSSILFKLKEIDSLGFIQKYTIKLQIIIYKILGFIYAEIIKLYNFLY